MTDDSVSTQRRRALAELERIHPRWECWVGTVPHLLYARVPKSSPPIVVRGATVAALEVEMIKVERERRLS